jgi:riboflavin biosynthesis pyrimidine reductase
MSETVREQPEITRLADDAQTTPADFVEQEGLWSRPAASGERPRVLLNMVESVDGRANLRGLSGPLSGPTDRALFHSLRAAADAVLVGAGTVRSERYGRLITNPDVRRLRRERGLSEEPLACIVSGQVDLEPDIPLLAEPEAHVAVLTASQASVTDPEAQVDYVRASQQGALDLRAGLVELRERFGVELVLCEGGPHLSRNLFAEGLIDELFLTHSPRLVGGDAADGEALRILCGPELDPPLMLELLGVLRSGSDLFLRYRVT